MGTIINRTAWFLKDVPRDIAYYQSERWSDGFRGVTWAEVHAERARRQSQILYYKRGEHRPVRRAVRISVRYFKQTLFGGWHTYIDGVGLSEWVRSEPAVEMLLRRFPLVPLPSGSGCYHWVGKAYTQWMEAFAVRYQRGEHGGRPRGCVYCWAMVDAHSGFARSLGDVIPFPLFKGATV